MFGRKKSKAFIEAEDIIERLSFSFLRGSIYDSREARNSLGRELLEVSPRLTEKERDILRASRPNLISALPPEGRENFMSFLEGGLGVKDLENG